MMIPQPSPTRRLHHLDGLRGLAALVVVFHHFIIAFDFALYTGKPRDSRGAWDLWLASSPFDVALPGNLSVCLFFALSGYVLAGAFARSPLGVTALVARRYVRLGVPILVVTLLAWALHAAGAMRHQTVAALTHSAWLERQMRGDATPWRAMTEGAYGSLLRGDTLFDSSLWTMSIEFAGSVCLILVFAGCRVFGRAESLRRRQGLVLLLFAAATYNSYLCLFGIGAALSVFETRRRVEPWCVNPWIVTGLIVAGLALGAIPHGQTRPDLMTWALLKTPLTRFTLPLPASFGIMGVEAFWHAVGSVLLLLAIDGNPRLRGLFSGKAFQFLGRISFPLYLIHVPVLLSVGCGIHLLLLSLGVPAVPATGLTFAAYACVAIAAGMALMPVETLAVRLSGLTGEAIQGRTKLDAASPEAGRTVPMHPPDHIGDVALRLRRVQPAVPARHLGHRRDPLDAQVPQAPGGAWGMSEVSMAPSGIAATRFGRASCSVTPRPSPPARP